MLGCEVPHRVRLERNAVHEAQRRAEITGRLHQCLAPPAETNDRRIEHAGPLYAAAGAPGCLSGWARANASFLAQVSAIRLTVGYGIRSTLKKFAPAT